MKYIKKLVIYFSLFYISSQITAYFTFELFCADDFIEYIEYSEGSIKPNNAQNKIREALNYIYYFPEIKHNLKESLCIYVYNFNTTVSRCYFAFNKALLNEYDISEIDYGNYWTCSNCNQAGPKNYEYNTKCFDKPLIKLSNGFVSNRHDFCLIPIEDISMFNQGEKYINKNYYSGKTDINFILNNDTDIFNIDKIFIINGKSNYVFDLDAVSLKIINIINYKGHIYNGNEEIFLNSTFNAKYNYLKYKKIDDKGYIMTITIETRTRIKNSISYLTCKNPAILNIYISQNNCTMTNFSNDFCQQCQIDYAKYGKNCYYKNEKFDYLYYKESSQTFERCENSNDIFLCNICPKGTYIKSKNISSQICEKCPSGYYTDEKDQDECKICPEGYYSIIGSEKCYLICNKGFYPNGTKCLECEPGYYSEVSSISCTECSPGTFSNQKGMSECLICEEGTYNNKSKQTECIDCPKGYYSPKKSAECFKCPLGTFNPYIKRDHCEECDYGYYNDIEGAEKCKICSSDFYSDERGSSSCKKCEKNTYSLYGFKKCLPCEKLIPNCNKCSSEGICLECNNHAKNGYNNCEKCEENWEYNGEICKPIKCNNFYYINKENNIINCINDIKECPKEMIYLNLNTKECEEEYNIRELENYQINGNEKTLNKISDEIFEKLKNFPDLRDEILDNKNITLIGINSTVQIGKIFENKYLNDTDNSSIPTMDYGNCPKVLRAKFEMKDSENILFKNLFFDVYDDGISTRAYLYREDDLENALDLNDCEDKVIVYITPTTDVSLYVKKYKNGERYLNFFEKANEIFDLFSPVYNLCFPLSILDKVDLTLKDRYKDIKESGLIVCYRDCKFEGLNIETFQIRCFCPIKIDPNKKSIVESFKDIKIWNNFEVMKCYKLAFSKEGQKNNIASEIIMVIIIMTFVFSVYTKIWISKGELNNLIDYCKDYINEKFGNNTTFNNEKNVNDSFYKCLIKSIPEDEGYKYLIENELNGLEYDYYKKIEVREFYDIIWSHFKINCDLLSTFFIFNKYEDFRFYTIKIIIYLNSLVLSFVGNVCFYSDDTMHKIYEENGNYNIEYKLPYVAISDIISIFASLVFEKLIDYQDDLINLKINMDKEERKEEEAKKIESSFKRNIKIFYVISFAIQVFSWYYISCFFAIYANTQIHLFKDFLLGLGLSLGNVIIKTIFILFFKLCIAKCFSKYDEVLNWIFKNIINKEWFNILLECLIELIILIIFQI